MDVKAVEVNCCVGSVVPVEVVYSALVLLKSATKPELIDPDVYKLKDGLNTFSVDELSLPAIKWNDANKMSMHTVELNIVSLLKNREE